MKRRRSPACGMLGLGLGWLVLAASGPPATADDGQQTGELLFRMHCVSCHGASGRGDGPMAADLSVRPADLTQLAARAGGKLPVERVHQIIDGRVEMRGHGSREMPIWGLSLQDLSRTDDQEGEVEERIRALIDYLQSIQKPAD